MSKKIVIVGGVACGAKTAARLMRIDPDADVTMIEKGDFLSYAGCGLPYYVGDVVKDYKELTSTPIGVVRDAGFFRKVKHVDVLVRHMATRIDRENKKVAVTDLNSGEEKKLSYDTLVLATGASPIRPPIQGADLEQVFTLWNMPDALAMKAAIDSGSIKSAVVIGGGLIGMEVVEALHNRGIHVSVIDVLKTPLPAMLNEDFGHLMMKVLAQKNIDFYGGERVTEIMGEGGVVTGVKTDQRIIDADMVLMAIGVRPNTLMAKEAGLDIGDRGGILVDEHMRTSDPYIYAGGDCVEVRNTLTGATTWQPMGSAANRHGRVIADNIAGMNSTFNGVIGTAVMKLFEYTAGKTGLNEAQARKFGYDPVAVTVVDADIPHFMPGASMLTFRLVADRKTRKVIGGQFFGPGKIDKRLDVLAAAVTGELTVDQLADTDLAYAPPYSTALDPLTHGANVLRNKLDGLLKSYSPSQLQERMKGSSTPLLLDVRTAPELESQGRIPYEFVHIPLGALWDKAPELPKDREIIAFCKISVRGWDAYSILKRLGFKNIAILEGGIMGWPYSLN